MTQQYASFRLVAKIMKGFSILGVIITLLMAGLLFYLGLSGDQAAIGNLGLGLYFLMAGNTALVSLGFIILGFGMVVSLVFFALGAVLSILVDVDENTRYMLMTVHQTGESTQPNRVLKG